MALKLSRGVWFVSILGALAALLYVYAGLPEEVILMQDGTDFIYGAREGFFYVALIVIALTNSFVFLVSAIFRSDEALRTWFNGLVVCLNLFFVISLFLLSAINSNEKFNYPKIGFMIYGSVALIAAWSTAWPVFLLIRKFSGKESVH